MIEIEKDYIPEGRRNRPGIPIQGPKYITLHDTGNSNPGADAQAHAKYLKGDDAARVPASWHFTVDDTRAIQHLPLAEIGWHAGDGGFGPGNRTSLGVEVCMNEDGKREEAEKNAAQVVAHLLEKFDLKLYKNVKQHYDWSGKNCPQVLRARPNGWANFLSLVEKYLKEGNGKVLEHIIVIGSYIDYPAAELLSNKLKAPIYTRESIGNEKGENLYVCGGELGKLSEHGEHVIFLSGEDRVETAVKIKEFVRGL